MRRVIFLVLAAILAVLLAARAQLPAPAAAAVMGPASIEWDQAAYNVLDWASQPRETAGSAFGAEMAGHFLSRQPTAKHPYTGDLAGKNLVVILAEDWKPDRAVESLPAGLARLWREGTQFTQVYAPDWYQGREGREFALLTGLTPTTVQDRTALAVIAQQQTSLPFALGRGLGALGYTCRAYGPEEQGAAYEVLGFEPAAAARPADGLAALGAAGPFCLYWVLEGPDGETALEAFRQALEAAGLGDSTAVCLVTGSQEPLRGRLFLRAPGLEGTAVTAPCSELDVTPTLLDLFGAAYDSRFLSGRDVFADGAGTGQAPLVSLYGSAYSDWVTDAGVYTAGTDEFSPSADRSGDASEQEDYVRRMQQEVYDRYIYSRRILESNYFRLAMGG